MPRRRSTSIESVRVVPASTLPSSGMAPASNSSRSVRLVLPASTCARIPRLSVRKGQLLQESGRDRRQGSCRTHHEYLLESHPWTIHYGVIRLVHDRAVWRIILAMLDASPGVARGGFGGYWLGACYTDSMLI